MKTLSDPVVRYLEKLELCLKAQTGVVPEDVLSDMRLHLQREHQRLTGEVPELSDAEVYDHLVSSLGEPEQIAAQLADTRKPFPSFLPGYAPGWRIYCTSCGRSAPLAKVGGIRIGARSTHKYVLGWCRGCRWFRWARVEQDLNDATLTSQLGAEGTPEQLRSSLHLPTQLLTWLALASFMMLVYRIALWML